MRVKKINKPESFNFQKKGQKKVPDQHDPGLTSYRKTDD